ncbi:phage tail protein [Streptomyces sp. WAC 06725]|uniref:phage tail protein n=1 Tax=Streptomyces sp. WAC 06725 TaxID=2203209 RepID=UPI000F74A347|nr:phage tail protein [Streptomyces sp. WAC 06725]RSO40119.1 phage tail protein [Streptomyces sp. WAC 06725]
MPLSPVTKVYSVKDAKVFRLTADPAGGTATFGPAVDAPGIQSMEISGDIETKKLRGDNGPLASNSTLSGITVKVEHAKLSLAALAVITSGMVTESGTTPAQKSEYTLTGDQADMPSFKIEGVTPPNGVDIIGGDLHWTLYCCTLTKFPELGFANEEYRIVSFEADANPLISSGKWISAVINETAVPITA